MIATSVLRPNMGFAAVRSPFAASTPHAAPAAAPSLDAVTLSGAAPPAEKSHASVARRVGLAGLAALSMFGAFTATAVAAEPPVGMSQSQVVRLQRNDQVTRDTRQYISDMLDNNKVQGETLNTYEKDFQNNYNTLVRIEARILKNPQSLNDPSIRRVYEKVQASLDSMQVFTDKTEDVIYQAGTQTVQTADGTTIEMPLEPERRVPHISDDYSGAARLTDHTIEQINGIMHPGA